MVRFFQINESVFYHGCNNYLDVGIVLTPRLDDYEQEWNGTDFYNVLEKYRPDNMLAHKQSVFMVADPDEVDLAGGGSEWLFTLSPLGKIQRHDMNWSSEISWLVGDGYSIESDEVISTANNYWLGKPHHDENLWEYLTTHAKIVKVEKY